MGRNILFTSGLKIVVNPATKPRHETKKIKILNIII